MWRSKKFIIAAVLAVTLLAGSIGGVVLAADNGDESEPATRLEIILDKVAAHYLELTGEELDTEALKSAFQQARDEIRAEALHNYLDKLVEDGVITQEEADEWSSWWASKPDTPIGFGLKSHGKFIGFCGPCFLIR